MKLFAMGLLGIVVGWLWGWEGAHRTVAKECETLGGFYVLDTTYKCAKAGSAE